MYSFFFSKLVTSEADNVTDDLSQKGVLIIALPYLACYTRGTTQLERSLDYLKYSNFQRIGSFKVIYQTLAKTGVWKETQLSVQ